VAWIALFVRTEEWAPVDTLEESATTGIMTAAIGRNRSTLSAAPRILFNALPLKRVPFALNTFAPVFIATLLILSSSSSLFLQAQENVYPHQENVLLIIADDVGVENVGCYCEGEEPAPTPNIDRLAQRGILFRNAWANPICSATRAGIHTGRHGFRTGVGFVVGKRTDHVLQPCETTLPEVLCQAGYSCGLIGKWHLGNRKHGGEMGPHIAGWSHFCGMIEYPKVHRANYYRWSKTINGQQSRCRTYATTENVNDALTWINRQERAWMCCLSFNAAHSPWCAPPADLHSYDFRGESRRRCPRSYFLAMVEAMDTEIGRLLDGLGKQRLQNTTIIFVGDNGTSSRVVGPPYPPLKMDGRRGFTRESVMATVYRTLTDRQRAKGTVYEAGVNVPLIISGPSVTNCGREVEALVHTVDLFSTVVELAGVDPQQAVRPNTALDSVSLVPYLVNADQPSLRRTVYTEIFLEHPAIRGSAAIRDQRYKLIWTNWLNLEEGFYDLWSDPHEQRNLLENGLAPEEEVAYQTLLLQMKSLWDSEAPVGDSRLHQADLGITDGTSNR